MTRTPWPYRLSAVRAPTTARNQGARAAHTPGRPPRGPQAAAFTKLFPTLCQEPEEMPGPREERLHPSPPRTDVSGDQYVSKGRYKVTWMQQLSYGLSWAFPERQRLAVQADLTGETKQARECKSGHSPQSQSPRAHVGACGGSLSPVSDTAPKNPVVELWGL